MLLAEPIENRWERAYDNGVGCDNPNLADLRVSQKFDVPYRLTKVIEHGGSALQQGTAIRRRLGTVTAAIEQPHANRLLNPQSIGRWRAVLYPTFAPLCSCCRPGRPPSTREDREV